MAVEPSCPAFLVLQDDPFRKSLIKVLDERHFSVSYAVDGDEAISRIGDKDFRVVILGVDLHSRTGLRTLEYLRAHREKVRCGVLILGDPHPEIRTLAPWADETLLKPVDAAYVAQRARTYCAC